MARKITNVIKRQVISCEVGFFENEGRLFSNIRFLVGDWVLGDFEQMVLLGSLELSVRDLVSNIARGENIDFGNLEGVMAVFLMLDDAVSNGDFKAVESSVKLEMPGDADRCFVAIPRGVEAFDGERAFLFKCEGRDFFVWRDWASKSIRSVECRREDFVGLLDGLLSEIVNFKNCM